MPERRVIRIFGGRAQVVADPWQVYEDAAGWNGERNALIPLAAALASPQRLDGGGVGAWLSPTDEPSDAVPLFGALALIAVRFPVFSDGRGYSTASLLRRRHGWRGELRAIGDVQRDQLFFMKRVGFDSFALRPDRNIDEALASLSDFSDSYQGSVEPALPAYRRIDQTALLVK